MQTDEGTHECVATMVEETADCFCRSVYKKETNS